MIRKKRRWLIVLFTIIVLFTLTSCFGGDPVEPNTPDVPDSNNSDQEPSNLIFYEIKNNYVTIGYEVGGLKDTSLKEVVIPKKYNNLPVIGIRDNAFEDYGSLINITIPDSVINIGDYAFSNCVSLTNITIPDSVMSIGNNAFYGCSNLKSIKIGSGITSIGYDAFRFCSNLKYNEHENGLYLGNEENLTLVLVEVKNNDIEEIKISDTAKLICNYAFDYCSNLTNITIPDSVINIGEMAFYGCSNLKSIKIGSSVTSIGSRAFYGCSSLTSIILPNSVTIIGDNAFHNCSNLTSIIIGNGITSFGSRAFYNCSSLDKVYYNGTIEDWCKIQFESSYYNSNPMFYAEHFYLRKDNNWEEVTSIEIPNTITEIGNYQFCEFNNVTSITIGNSVTSIGRWRSMFAVI